MTFSGRYRYFGNFSANTDNRLYNNLVPCFPKNKTGLVLIFTPKYGTRAYFRGMYYFDISKNEVTK